MEANWTRTTSRFTKKPSSTGTQCFSAGYLETPQRMVEGCWRFVVENGGQLLHKRMSWVGYNKPGTGTMPMPMIFAVRYANRCKKPKASTDRCLVETALLRSPPPLFARTALGPRFAIAHKKTRMISNAKLELLHNHTSKSKAPNLGFPFSFGGLARKRTRKRVFR